MTEDRTPVVNRRTILLAGLTVGSGLAAAALLGCGGSKGAGGATSGGGPSAASTTSGGTKARPYSQVVVPSTKSPKDGGSLALSKGQDVGSFDPTKSGATGNLTHTGTVYDTLLRRKMTTKESDLSGSGSPQSDIEGALAESWEVTPDGLTYSFKMRPGVKWQNVAPLNGRPFVAEDVRKAFARYGTTGVWQQNFANVAKMEALDAQTLKITLKQPEPDFVVPLAEQNNAIFPMELVDNGTIDKAIVGTGPFILKDVQAGQAVQYVRNPDYWGPKPHLDAMEYRIIQDNSAALAAFRAGQVGAGPTVTTTKDVDAIKGSIPDVQVTQSIARKSIFFTAFNMNNPKWQDERVRQAFSLAQDRDAVNATLYDNLSVILPVMPWIYVFDHEPTYQAGELGKWWHLDLAESKKLLQAAGAENMKFDYPYYNGYLTNQNDLIIDQWRQAGFQVNPQQLDYVSFNSQLAAVKYQDTIQAWDPHGTQADNYFKNQLQSGSAGNWFTIKDPQIDAWADKQSVELDPQARRQILRQIWERVLDKAYRVELMNSVGFSLFQPWLHGLTYIVGNDGLGPSVFGYNNNQFLPSVWMDK